MTIQERNAIISECIAAIHGEYPYNDIDRDPNAGPPPSKDFRDGWNTLRLKVINRMLLLKREPDPEADFVRKTGRVFISGNL